MFDLGMEHDSIDVSQLKAFALTFDNKSTGTGSTPRDTSKVHKAKIPEIVKEPNFINGHQLRDNDGQFQEINHSNAKQNVKVSHVSKTPRMSGGTELSGDTQPLSQWVYDEHTMRNKGQEKVVENSTRDTATHNTLHTGQRGYVDLVGALDEPDASDGEGSDGAHENGIAEISQVEVRAEIFPEHKRFQVPKTPATNGKKSNHQGEVLNSGDITPRLPVNPFGRAFSENVGGMGLSQVFRATQAGTSPLTNLLPSDVPSTRPSPAFNPPNRPPTTGSLSSPAVLRHTRLQRATTEPHSKYVSMQESQAERRKRQQKHSTSSPADKRRCEWGFSDDELDPVEQRAWNRKRQERREAAAKKQFAGMTEALSETNPTSRQVKLPRQREPSSPTLRKANGLHMAKVPVEETIDLTTGNLTEDETEHEDNLEERNEESSDDLDELVEDDKENVGRRPVHIVTPKSKRGRSRTIIARSSPELRRQALSSPVAQEEVDELDADDFPQPLPQPRLPVTIADSQSSQKLPAHKQRQLSEHDQPPTRVSSPASRSIIPQSQMALHTSQLDSSMRRHLSEPSPLFVASKTAQDRGSPNSKRSYIDQQERASQSNVEELHQNPVAYESSPPVPMRAPAVPSALELVNAMEPGPGPGEGLQLVQQRASSPTRIVDKSKSKDVACSTPTGSSTVNHATLRSTIPETSSVVRHVPNRPADSHQHISTNDNITENAPKGPISARQSNSKTGTDFETAPTHLTASPSKALNQQTSQVSISSKSPTSPAFTRIRKFNDIAADPSPPDEVGDVDVEFNLMTGEDVEFQSLIEGSSPIGPLAKRRRRTQGRRGGSDVRGRFDASSELASSPAIGSSGAAGENVPVATRAHENDMQITEGEHDRKEDGSDRDDRAPKSPCPNEKQANNVEVLIHHPPVMKGQEQMSTASKDPKKPHAREANDQIAAATKESGSRVGNIASRRLSHRSRDPANDQDIDELAQPGGDRQVPTTTHRGSPPTAINVPQQTLQAMSSATTKMLAPTRVLAHFNATCPGFYPATCLYPLIGEPMRYRVRFDDETTADLHPNHVKRLELRAGDLVKLDEPGTRANTYVVQSVQGENNTTAILRSPVTPSKRNSRQTDGRLKYPKTDIFGNTMITVSLKENNKKPTSVASTPTQTVSLDSVYLPQSLFKKLKDRAYTHPSPSNHSAIQTPSEIPSIPSTPSSRTRRNRASYSSFDAPPSASKATHQNSGLFGNMVFSITNVSDNTRPSLVRSISTNGGTILDSPHGFRELFVDDTSSTPGEFALTSRTQGKGFTALLADQHCRRAKYIQALALGIPCLSTRWIKDCVSAEELLAWEPYLLAAGESSFLNGAIRSRLLPSYAPESATLSTIISSRPRFLEGRAILLIIGKGNSADIMKNYPIIARALGARKVDTVVSAEEGREKLKGERYDWVYFYGGEKAERGSVEGVESVLFGRGKKRKRGGREEDFVVERGGARVVTTEFVVQSLILGGLVPGV